MTPPSPQLSVQTRTRVKWDNILIVVAGTALAAVAVVLILASGSATGAKAPTTHASTPPATTSPTADAVTTPAAADGALTLEDSQGLVDEAKDLLASARFDEAIDRLETVPAEYTAQTGSAQLEAQATADRTQYATMRKQLDAALEARQFTDADKLVKAMLLIAPKDASLADAQATISDGLTAAATPAATAKPKPDGAKPAAATTKQPATNTATAHPATTPTHPPTTGTAKPKAPATGGGAAAGTGNVTGVGTGTLPTGNLQLTQAQQQELAQALAALG
jgi:hypothetical protein